jgi:hypothetical protein
MRPEEIEAFARNVPATTCRVDGRKPAVSSGDGDMAGGSATEIVVLWGTTVLFVSHIAPTRSFYIGEEDEGSARCDYFIPSETLGTTRAPLVVSRDGQAALVVLPGTTGYADLPGYGRLPLRQLAAAEIPGAVVRASTEVTGALELDLSLGASARVELEGTGLAFIVTVVHPGKGVPAHLAASVDADAALTTGLSFFVHASLVAMLAFLVPPLRDADAESLDRDRVFAMQKLLNAAAEREHDASLAVARPFESSEGGTGARSAGEGGAMGTPETRSAGHRYAVQGPRDNPDPHLARAATLKEASEFAMIGLVASVLGGPRGPTASWGREDSSGRDGRSAAGNMFGADVADSVGAGGLDVSGVGEGADGRGIGIGIGDIGGLGNGAGPGEGGGIGHGRDTLHRGHEVRSPHILDGATAVSGRLPPEIVQRIVRENFARFRFCYENGLRQNPTLAGRVSVRFVIDRTGAVAVLADGGSDLPDHHVVECVVRSFGNLSFPEPAGGSVTVTYPITFSPGE